MTSKPSSDDPMDLGPFLMNLVMKNPFREKVFVNGGNDRQSRTSTTFRPQSRMSTMSRSRVTNSTNGEVSKEVDTGCAVDVDDVPDVDKIGAWLHENYRCLGGRRRLLVGKQHLLLRLQQVFPNVTSEMVDDVVRTTFPGCFEFSNKRTGLSFYQGLVSRPDPEVYRNPTLIAAMDSVANQMLTTAEAASKFGMRESSLLAAISWSDTCSNVVSPSDTGSTEDRTTSPCNNGVQTRTTGLKRGKSTESIDQELQYRRFRPAAAGDDDNVDFEQMLQDANVKNDNQMTSQTEPSSPQFNTSPEPTHDSPNRVTIKSESPSSTCSSTAGIPTSLLDDASNSYSDQPLNFSIAAVSHADVHVSKTETITADNSTVSVSSSSATALSTEGCSDDVSTLRSRLSEALETNLTLQEELNTRDFHLVQLAEDFFCLHEQFKQLAQHFQTVLRDLHPVSDQSSTPQLQQNHIS